MNIPAPAAHEQRMDTLRFIIRFHDITGLMPTWAEVAAYHQITKQGAGNRLKALEREGYIRRKVIIPRAIRIRRGPDEYRPRTPLCEAPGCTAPRRAGGYCNPHYHKNRRYGDPLGAPAPRPTTCKIAGCEREPHGRGWCHMHYRRWYIHGDPLMVKSSRWRIVARGGESCP